MPFESPELSEAGQKALGSIAAIRDFAPGFLSEVNPNTAQDDQTLAELIALGLFERDLSDTTELLQKVREDLESYYQALTNLENGFSSNNLEEIRYALNNIKQLAEGTLRTTSDALNQRSGLPYLSKFLEKIGASPSELRYSIFSDLNYLFSGESLYLDNYPQYTTINRNYQSILDFIEKTTILFKSLQ